MNELTLPERLAAAGACERRAKDLLRYSTGDDEWLIDEARALRETAKKLKEAG